MPEGPEVKTVARTLSQALVGQRLGALWHSHHKLRRSVDYEQMRRLENHVIDDVTCFGKILFININKKPALMAQLGMTGQLKVESQNAPVPLHTHLRWPLIGSDCELRYVDPRRFGLIDVCDDAVKLALIKRLGPDPFSMTEREVADMILAMKKSHRPIKEVLLDQSIVAGVGNIYASEALFLARITPSRRASAITDYEYGRLVPAIINVLELAYKNCGTTFSNYVDGSGQKGQNLAFLKVFQRDGEPCTECSTPIERIKQSGRSSFFCPKCQPG